METKGPTLEEIARIFDGDEAIAHIDFEQLCVDRLHILGHGSGVECFFFLFFCFVFLFPFPFP